MRYIFFALFSILYSCVDDHPAEHWESVDNPNPEWIEPDNPVAPDYLAPPEINFCEYSICYSNPEFIVLDFLIPPDGGEINENILKRSICLDEVADYCFGNGWRLPRFQEIDEIWHAKGGGGLIPSIVDCGDDSVVDVIDNRANTAVPKCYPSNNDYTDWYGRIVYAYCVVDDPK